MISKQGQTRIYLFLVILALYTSVHAKEEIQVNILNQELSITRYVASGKYLILWIAPGVGSHEREFKMSHEFVNKGIEVWHVDLVESLFLPKGTLAMRSLTGKYIAGLIEYAHKKTGKKIALLARSYGAIPLLRGARLWQADQKEKIGKNKIRKSQAGYLTGAILFSPELYSTIPALGRQPVYEPIIYATNIPIMLYQGALRGNRWQLNSVVKDLQKGGAQVYVKVQRGVTGLFYKKDSSPVTLKALKMLPHRINAVLSLLERTRTPLYAQALPALKKVKNNGLDSILRPYRGNEKPLPLDLVSAKGKRVIRTNYKGKVTIVNYWATWCPPCVKEIPSLNHLRKIMKGKNFELISINYAEDKQQVTQFLKKVNVDFPVLLDEDGSVSSKWNVLVFPSTFVIGPDGKIKYGVNAAIHWDSPEVIKKINKLFQ